MQALNRSVAGSRPCSCSRTAVRATVGRARMAVIAKSSQNQDSATRSETKLLSTAAPRE